MNQPGMSNTLAAAVTPEITAQLQLADRITEDLLERIHMLTERLSGVMLPTSGAEKDSCVATPMVTKLGSIINLNNARIESAIRKIENINSNLAL